MAFIIKIAKAGSLERQPQGMLSLVQVLTKDASLAIFGRSAKSSCTHVQWQT